MEPVGSTSLNSQPQPTLKLSRTPYYSYIL